MEQKKKENNTPSTASKMTTEVMINNDNTQQQQLKGAVAGNLSAQKEALLGLVSGMAFGMVSPTVGHPFDTVKTRMQVDPAFTKLGFVQSVSRIYRLNGMGGFYRGFVPPLLGSVMYRGLQFSAYSGAYSYCGNYDYLSTEIPFTGGLQPRVLLGGFAAGATRAAIESPLDFIKLRAQIGQSTFAETTTSKTATATTRSTVLENTLSIGRSFASSPIKSVTHLYNGFVPTLCRSVGLLGSFFIMVDYSVRYIPDVVGAPLIGPFFKGGICATTAWLVAFPFETVKSTVQADVTGKFNQQSTISVLRGIVKEKGIKGLYRGFGPGAGRSFIANGTSMVVYSWFQDQLRQ
jgi:solute carrier family 25 carnitine/acylcarnitine transporter 20/29